MEASFWLLDRAALAPIREAADQAAYLSSRCRPTAASRWPQGHWDGVQAEVGLEVGRIKVGTRWYDHVKVRTLWYGQVEVPMRRYDRVEVSHW